jgi:lon-related putative ATP-dependent protease
VQEGVKMIAPLSSDKAYKSVTMPVPFETTDDIEALEGFLNHDRAFEAIQLALDIDYDGYNLYVMGAKGSGKHLSVEEFIKQIAASKSVPNDLCYVYNFENPDKPVAIILPAGEGAQLKNDMKKLIEHLKNSIPAMFKSNEYFFKKRDIDDWLKTKQEDAFYEIMQQAKDENLLVEYTEEGYTISPTNQKGEVLSPKEYKAFSDEQKEQIKQTIQSYKEKIDTVSSYVVSWSNEARDRMQKLEHFIAKKAIEPGFEKLFAKYKNDTKVTQYLQAVKEDIIENAKDFLPDDSNSQIISFANSEPDFSVYEVNLLVNNKNQKGAPVIYEDNPTYSNLFGVVEYQSQMGALVTDFNYVKPGSFHLSNGGYLILDIEKVLMQPYVWEGLKRMLVSKKITIDTISDLLGLNATVTLKPQKVDLNIKIVLIGSRDIYYLLYNYDEDFQKLFKINADFEDAMKSDAQNIEKYLKMLAKIIANEGLKPHDKAAVAKLLEYGMRLSESQNKISTQIMHISDLMKEATFIAKTRQKNLVGIDEVQAVLLNKQKRADRVMQNIYETIEEGTIMLDFEGKIVGQINAMSVIDMGDISFGEPVKITALTRLGKGEVIDIQREVDLGGPIHSKGVMTLSSYLSYKYAKQSVMSMSASLSFEQSYGQIEGDSASLAELCAIISSLSELAIDQSFAVTGSINQMGFVQPVGGINEKIEGFFKVTKRLGHSKNNVIIPHTNVKHLMLHRDILDAIDAKEFFIYAVKTVDEAIALLMGKSAGKEVESGVFEKESINEAVAKKLRLLAQKAHQKNYKEK